MATKNLIQSIYKTSKLILNYLEPLWIELQKVYDHQALEKSTFFPAA
jgi:hypothetical protein